RQADRSAFGGRHHQGLPATGISGLGIDKVCGRILFPIPAIGTIIFINSLLLWRKGTKSTLGLC
ncbi:MAG: hypothetical protein ACKPB3_00870, partial [Bacteroidota bacterium]